MKSKINFFKYGPLVRLWTGTFLMTAAVTAVVFIVLYPAAVASIVSGIVESAKNKLP